jgi:MFS family permease
MGPERVALAGLAALAVAMGIGRFAFTPILPMMQADAGVSVAAGGWLAAANYVGYLGGALTATRVGLRAPGAIRAGLLTIGVATLAMAAADQVALWLLLRALAGVASAWVLIHVSAWSLERLGADTPAGGTHSSELDPRDPKSGARRPVLASVVFAGVGIGIALAGALCVAIMALDARSDHAWGVLGTLALVLAAAIWPAFGGGDVSRDAAGASSPARASVSPPAAPAPRSAAARSAGACGSSPSSCWRAACCSLSWSTACSRSRWRRAPSAARSW